MSAVAKLRATKQPPIQLKPSLLCKDHPAIAVYNQVVIDPTQKITVSRKVVLPFCPNSSDEKRLVRCFHNCLKVTDSTNLSIKDKDPHLTAREVRGWDLKATWS